MSGMRGFLGFIELGERSAPKPFLPGCIPQLSSSRALVGSAGDIVDGETDLQLYPLLLKLNRPT
jgi:hypothetical protein